MAKQKIAVKTRMEEARQLEKEGKNADALKIYRALSRRKPVGRTTVSRLACNVPAATEFVRIAGANHAQFGYYGFQFGDDSATISRQQQTEMLKQIRGFID